MFNKILITFFLSIIINIGHCESRLIVASFNSILTDFAYQIGKDKIEIIEVMKPGADVHKFTPNPKDLQKTINAKILLFMGKNLEFYLPKVKDMFLKDQVVLEVGNFVPSLIIENKDDIFECSHEHEHGHDVIDPHWWHSINNSIKAIRIIYRNFKKLDPENNDFYYKNYLEYKLKLEELLAWAKIEINKISRNQRILTTSHAAFGYFCKEFGFKSVPILGLTKEQNPNPEYLKKVIKIIRKENVKVAFPELLANPKILKTITSETKIIIGDVLITNSPESYIDMIKNNINSIIKAFRK